ncbi:MAG: hypothetical protein ACX94C_11790 [Phycisphaerales bacterium]
MSTFSTDRRRRPRVLDPFDAGIDPFAAFEAPAVAQATQQPVQAPDPVQDRTVRSPLSIEAELDPMAAFESSPVSRVAQPPTRQAGAALTPVSDRGPELVPGDPAGDPFGPGEVRQTRKRLSSQIRTAQSQSLEVRKDLNRARQQALREGRNADAASIMERIQEIANATDGDVENLRDLLQLERSMTPSMSPERRQAGRGALDAQLPAVREAFAQQQQELADGYQERMAEIGGQALALETGLNPDEYMDESLAQFAQTASPEVVDRVTRGVGLPQAPGGDGGVGRVQSLIDQGGVGYGDPLAPFETDQSAVDRGLLFMGNVEADRAAQETIRDANREAAVGQSVAGAAQVRDVLDEFGVRNPMDTFNPGSTLGEQGFQRPEPLSIEQSLVESGLGGREDLTTAARQFDAEIIQSQIAEDVRNQNSAGLDSQISKIGFVLNDPEIKDSTKRELAQMLLGQLEGVRASRDDSFWQTVGSYVQAAFDEPVGAANTLMRAPRQVSGDEMDRFDTALVSRQNAGSPVTQQINRQLDALRNRLRVVLN